MGALKVEVEAAADIPDKIMTAIGQAQSGTVKLHQSVLCHVGKQGKGIGLQQWQVCLPEGSASLAGNLENISAEGNIFFIEGIALIHSQCTLVNRGIIFTQAFYILSKGSAGVTDG